MIHFISNAAIASWLFAIWYMGGLGFSLALLPRYRRSGAFLLAPLLGMCLLTLIGLYQITVPLMPITPRINACVLLVISFVLCLRHNRLRTSFQSFRHRKELRLWLPSLLLLLVFAWLFHNNGFHILVGSSDQLQYAQDARQMLEEMHTGSAKDIPIARQDHYVYDLVTRMLPYLKTYRRGAEVILATNASLSPLNIEEAFPATVLCIFLTLGCALGFLGRVFLRLPLSVVLILQVTVLSSFYLLLIHIQGSLALAMSIAPGLMAIGLLARFILESSWRWLPLTALMVAAYLAIYSEPALINIILPSMLLALWYSRKSISNAWAAIRKISALYFSVWIFAPFAIYAVAMNALTNIKAIFAQTMAMKTPAAAPLVTNFHQWDLSAITVGSVSYYDASAFNTHLTILLSTHPLISAGIFIFLGISGVLGFLNIKNPLAALFAIILTLWMAICVMMGYQQDYLRFVRSMYYAMPFALLGLVLLATSHSKRRISLSGLVWTGRVTLTLFIGINLFTCARTIHYITSHNFSNDTILMRFDERLPEWMMLRNELQLSAAKNAPVLITGFKDTITPFAIAIDIRSQPHFLGKGIREIWPIYSTAVPAHMFWSDYNSRLSEKQLSDAYQLEGKPWSVILPDLTTRSVQAISPIGLGYPAEWSNSQDVFAFRITRIPPIGEVIYRHQFDVTLADKMVSGLKRDAQGPFRLIQKSGHVLVHHSLDSPHVLTLDFDGDRKDVLLVIRGVMSHGQVVREGKVRITAEISLADVEEIKLEVMRAVKLRGMSWVAVG